MSEQHTQLGLFDQGRIFQDRAGLQAQYVPRASLNYIGSKHKLIPFISSNIFQLVGDLSGITFAEVFAGTGALAKHFKPQVKHLIVNDLEPYSYILNRNYIGNRNFFPYDSLLATLNRLEGVDGLIYQHYCLGSGSERQYFSDENGRRIDAVRQQIERWKYQETISEDQYYFLLASLLESADKVANVASVYGAFLKHLKRTARKPLIIAPAVFPEMSGSSEVFQCDANSLISKITGDVLYLDPPYNHRQYGANYHLLNTIALYDEFEPRGKTGLRDYERSDYCRREQALIAFQDLIENAQFKYIFLSYNNEGIMSVDDVRDVMQQYGEYTLKTKRYQRFKADNDQNRSHKASSTEEYLHILIKN